MASIEKVADELFVGKDDLSALARERGRGFFLKPDEDTLSALRTVSIWANRSGYRAAAVSTFPGLADCWLVAHAQAHGYTVVTHEVAAGTVRRIKIPDVCRSLGLRYTTPCAMLRSESARFVLGDDRTRA